MWLPAFLPASISSPLLHHFQCPLFAGALGICSGDDEAAAQRKRQAVEASLNQLPILALVDF